eukprot:CAMPEP_0170192228 /NCGR_PEP_ID=MMETSP0040_2-20121228/53630_1 /TAXON_ID=641309 /ORGANISM="Lotharella oceanica, Strain CCMP622" /LENGTH=89 /DNA_ID=CAMNT_0010440515 /DNA_START=56 /DNA_END=325 /DNA_ORIENTATION=-
MYEYKGGVRKDELKFVKGEKIAVTDDSDPKGKGWWLGYINSDKNRQGWFPKAFVSVLGPGAPPPPGPPPTGSRRLIRGVRGLRAATTDH